MLQHVIRICDVTMCKCFKSVLFFIYIYYIHHNMNHINEQYVIGLHSVPCSYWSERLLKDLTHLDCVTKDSTLSQYTMYNVR